MDTLKPKITIGLVGVWFITAYTCLLFAILFSVYLLSPRVVQPVGENFNLFAALPQATSEVSQNISAGDARSKIIENFFTRYGSPLADYAQVFVAVADQNGLDYKLMPSIAMQESKGGQKIIDDSFNPFGFGIYGKSVVRFSSWQEAIEKVGHALKQDYIDQGLKTPVQIMAKYTPPSLNVGGSWARGVSSFMDELR